MTQNKERIEDWYEHRGLKIKTFFIMGCPAYTMYHVFPNGKWLTVRAMGGFKNLDHAFSSAMQYIDLYMSRIEEKIAKNSKIPQ